MILPNKQDALHRAMLCRLLIGIIDSPKLSKALAFKGGTAATMLGWLDRFSLDLNFDLLEPKQKQQVARTLEPLIQRLGFDIKQKAANELFYVLKYQAPANQQQYLKLSIMSQVAKSNQYQVYFLPEINRYCQCQTPDSMFANKLVALTDRYTKHQVIAGRDLYDIHYFFCQGFEINELVIKERLNKNWEEYRLYLINFIKNKVTQKMIDEDLNFLLPSKQFKIIRTVLKGEVLAFLKTKGGTLGKGSTLFLTLFVI